MPFYLVFCRISYTENHRFSQLFNQRVCERLNWSQPAAPVTFLPHLPPPRWPQCLMLYHVLSHVRIGCWSRCAIPTSLCVVPPLFGPREGEMLRKRVHAKGRRCLTTPKIWLCVRVPFRFRGLCVCLCVSQDGGLIKLKRTTVAPSAFNFCSNSSTTGGAGGGKVWWNVVVCLFTIC